MNDYPGSLPPAGWYPDPYGSPIERWWDGQGWTEHMNTPAPPVVQPVAPPVAQPAYEAPVEQPSYEQPFVEPLRPFVEPFAQPVQALAQEPAADPFATSGPFAAPHPYSAPQQTHPQPLQFPESQSPEPLQYPEALQYPEPVQYPEALQYPEPVQYQQPEPYLQPESYLQPDQYQQPEPYLQPEQYQQPEPFQKPANTSDSDFDFSRIISGDLAGAQPSTGFDEEAFSHWSNEDYQEPTRNPAATAGLTFGVLSVPLPGIGGILGLVFSIIGLGRASRAAREEGRAVGRGKAIAGLVLSLVGTAAAGVIVMVLFPGLLASLLGTDPAATDDAATGSLVDDATLTQNGNVGLELGTVGTIAFPDTTDSAISFTITAIEPNTTCTADPSTVLSPENGQFMAVTLQFDTAAGYESVMTSGGLLQPGSADWIGYLDDGTMITNTDAGSSCIPEDAQLPLDIPSGSSVTGTVILDMTADVIAFSWSPTGVANVDPTMNRWEWPAL